MNGLREESHLVLELRDRDAAAALVGGRLRDARDQRVLLQEPGDGALQLAGAVARGRTGACAGRSAAIRP